MRLRLISLIMAFHGFPVARERLLAWFQATTPLKYYCVTLEKLYKETNISLNWMKLSSIPIEIGTLSRLQRLSLAHNRLKFLPPEIGGLKQLKALAIEENRLRSLPAEVGKLA
jgi:hypothetical protein